MNKEVEIVPEDKSNAFVGIKIEEGRVKVHVPKVFRQDENFKRDIRLFLKSIEIAKTQNKANIKKDQTKQIMYGLLILIYGLLMII